MAVPASLRKRVARRAKHRCEYCGLSQAGQAATFHVDHIVPQVAGGESSLENLALACVYCSLRKGGRGRLLVTRRAVVPRGCFIPGSIRGIIISVGWTAN
jgi:5-methylcytosine-specific restriction endonuclease McrA